MELLTATQALKPKSSPDYTQLDLPYNTARKAAQNATQNSKL